jgi:glycopeptide antibiotics resistance protein
MKKRRIVYFILYLLIIPIGYSTRKMAHLYHPFIAEHGGDALWAAMFVFLFRSIWPSTKLWKVMLYSYLLCIAIEVSELYHAPWIDDIRRTFLGKMILGWGFLWGDFVRYLCGVLFAWFIATLADKYTSNK